MLTARRCLPLVLLAALACAERLPIHVYNTTDGLLEDGAIEDIYQDSSGYLWFVSSSGLSRFDGREFRNYAASQGVAGAGYMVEAAGAYWIATSTGVARYDPLAPDSKRFSQFAPGPDKYSEVTHLAADAHGGLWIATGNGVYYGIPDEHGLTPRLIFRPESPAGSEPPGSALALYVFVDRHGGVWASDHFAIYRVSTDGRHRRYAQADGLPKTVAGPFFEDRTGRLWLSTAEALIELDPDPAAGHPLVKRRIDTRFGAETNLMLSVCETPDGHLWLASHRGLLEFDGLRLRRYTRANGLPEDEIWSVAVDRNGNLWAGTGSAGVVRIDRKGFTTFGEADGVSEAAVKSVMRWSTGEFAAILKSPYGSELYVWESGRFHSVRPRFPASATYQWGAGQVLVRDRFGETWFATRDGLIRFASTPSLLAIDGRAPLQVYTSRDGMPSDNAVKVFEDSRGDVWIGCQITGRATDATRSEIGIARWIRAEDRFEDLSHAPGMPPGVSAWSFLETGDGAIWMGIAGGVLRWQADRVTFFPIRDASGARIGIVNYLYSDGSGHIWGAATGGMFVSRQPAAAVPQFESLSSPDPAFLAKVACIVADNAGRIYAGGAGGVARFDPATGEAVKLNANGGLASTVVDACGADSDGHLWFGTGRGLSRLSIESDPAPAPPPARILAVQIAGEPLALSDLGETSPGNRTLPYNRNSLHIAYAAIAPSGAPSYRYRLSGAGAAGWSDPSPNRSVDYANLAPGQYRFEVQTAGLGGSTGPPATFQFVILRPLWLRWWFLTLAAAAVCAAAYGAIRFRVEQLLALERMRNVISADLHDEVGSSLTRIAVGLEVARQRLGAPEAETSHTLDHLADIAREATASMSNIVWAVKPGHDSLANVAARIRRQAAETLEAAEISSRIEAPESDAHLKLGIEARRQIFLIAKEAVNNIVRHSGATSAAIEWRVEPKAVVLRIGDNGKGFDPASSAGGNGLGNMRARAEKMRAELNIDSSPGSGTTLELRVPLP